MDAITRVSYYFPTHTLTIFQILGNLVINDNSFCEPQQQSLMIAMLVLFGIACFLVSFTDTYTAMNSQKFWVLVMPFYGPLCFSLPTEEDKDRVYDFFYLKIRDYVHATLSVTAFILISLFTNPICMCIFPSGNKDGTSSFDPAIVRTVPIVVALLTGMVMICLGPPRQMLGFQNAPETCPAVERPMNSNPMFAGSQAEYPPTIAENDEDYEGGPPKEAGPSIVKGSMQRPPRESYASEYTNRPGPRQSTRNFPPPGTQKSGEYGGYPGPDGYSSGGGAGSGNYRGEP